MRCYGDNYTFIFHAPVAEMAERRFLTLECRVPFSFLRSLLFIFRRVQECITLNVQKYCHAQQTTNLGENTACWTFGRLPSRFFLQFSLLKPQRNTGSFYFMTDDSEF